ncbi:MAG: CrcB family protein [Pirellulales bacterium]|nr:CrcB family protein [Planctomycetales bacterium]
MIHSWWFQVLCVAGAGAVGALCRWGIGNLAQYLSGGHYWPYGTWAVNLLGCLLFGFTVEMLRRHAPGVLHWELLLFVGFLGALTTFSTFAFDTYELLLERGILLALANSVLQVIAGVTAVGIGVVLGRTL